MIEFMRRSVGCSGSGRAGAPAASLALLMVTIAACATVGPPPLATVSESDFARLPADKTQRVDAARQQLMEASDELGRAKLGAVDVQHEGAFARSDQAAASADLSRAETEAKVGRDSNEPDQLKLARDDTRSAQQDKVAADARLAYSKKLSISRAAQVTAAERKVELRTEEVNLAKLQALEEAGVAAAGKYDRATAMERVAKAQRAYQAATTTAAQAARETADAMTQWKSHAP